MKQHSIQQQGFETKIFDGTLTSLETLKVDIETTAGTQGWNKLFMMCMNISPERLDTLKLFSHKEIETPTEVSLYYFWRQESKK